MDEQNVANLGISKKKLDELLAMKPFSDKFAVRRASLRKVETINTTITGRKVNWFIKNLQKIKLK